MGDKRPSYEEFKILLSEGKEKIPIWLEECEDLESINERIMEWLNKAYDEITIGIDFDGLETALNLEVQQQQNNLQMTAEQMTPIKNQLDRDKILSIVYLESHSLPVEFPEAEELLLLLKQRDWLRKAYKAIMNFYLEKSSKIQTKKNVKRLLSQAGVLRASTDQKIQSVCDQLQELLTLDSS